MPVGIVFSSFWHIKNILKIFLFILFFIVVKYGDFFGLPFTREGLNLSLKESLKGLIQKPLRAEVECPKEPGRTGLLTTSGWPSLLVLGVRLGTRTSLTFRHCAQLQPILGSTSQGGVCKMNCPERASGPRQVREGKNKECPKGQRIRNFRGFSYCLRWSFTFY